MLNSTIELADEWELEDESEGGGEGSPPSDVDEEEADSPPRRRRPPEHSQRPSARRRPSSSPAAKGKALSKITKAYHLVMTLARRVQQTPHAFRGEMEWGADNVFNGNFTNDIVQHATGATDGLWCGEGPLSGLHLSLPQPAEAPAPEYCDLVHGVDGQPSAREPVKYSKAEFAYRLIQFARTMPESMDREIHFDITYVVDLITQMSKYDVKCVVDYDKLVRQKLATGLLTTSAKMASLLLTYLTVWNSVDLSEHGVSLEALREFENSTVEMGAAVPKVTEFADRWAVVFQDDPAVNDLVSPVSLGAGWKFNPDSIVMSGKNYLKEAFDFKVDKHHQEELTARRVVPVPEGWARAIHGVGVVDKDHSRRSGWYTTTRRMMVRHFMVKVDIKSAYRHFPIALQYLPYHTYRWRGEVVTDIGFPFGHRAVPGKFHKVTAALIRFMRAQGFPATVGYLDDFWVCCPTAAEAHEALLLLGDVLRFLGLEVAERRKVLPREKCLRLRTQVLGLAEKGWARRKDLERLMGQLAFAFRVVVLNRREVSSSHFSVDASTGTGMGGFLDGDFFGMSWVKWVPSKVNTFADALGRQEWQLFYQLRTEWLRDSVWRKDTDDWQLLRRVFRDLDDRPGVGPFSIDACCDESGPNAQTTNFWTVTQDCLQPDWEGHNAWCNPPFFRILEILQHFLECKRRQNVGTAACFVIPVWPTAGFFKFIEARPTVFFPRVRFDADSDLFTAPAAPGQSRRDFGPTRWAVTI
eukprot:gene9830-biopygen10041